MLGRKALKIARAKGFKQKQLRPPRLFASFILKNDEDIKRLIKFRANPDNKRVKAYILNLTGKPLNVKYHIESLNRICEICNKSNGYERYIVDDEKIVEKSAAPVITQKEVEPEKFRRYSESVLNEEYIQKWRRDEDGNPLQARNRKF
ncbi:MAG: hypothetical protein DRG78_21350 [Epsilonproteobacteria bacterium]|nr:MAG: hypothetical protein DRG78_21350 [Campylobacterota bacterium]